LAAICLSHLQPSTPSGIIGLFCLFSSIALAHSSLNHKLEARATNDSDILYSQVFTVGCFDLFHQGHINLFTNMKGCGRVVLAGVHTDESIFQLKKKYPIDPLEKRIANVKQFADIVFVIPSTDPTPFVLGAVGLQKGETAAFIRGDDMPNFPGRGAVEKIMHVIFVPYTAGISSTMLRSKLLSEPQTQTPC